MRTKLLSKFKGAISISDLVLARCVKVHRHSHDPYDLDVSSDYPSVWETMFCSVTCRWDTYPRTRVNPPLCPTVRVRVCDTPFQNVFRHAARLGRACFRHSTFLRTYFERAHWHGMVLN